LAGGVKKGIRGTLYRSCSEQLTVWHNQLMAAKDIYHQHVRRALEKDGWTITDDPLSVQWLGRALQIDLGAERIIAAQRNEEKIAIEVKSFLSPSPMEDLRDAIGQFIIYREALYNANSPRQLYMALREDVYADIFEQPEGELLRARAAIKIIVFHVENEEIIKWIN
jgi:hypothetical protein